MRTLPKVDYSGLTIVLDKPSRFDRTSLISGWAGEYFDSCLASGGHGDVNRYSCDIRTLDTWGDLLPNTKSVLLLGQDCINRLAPEKFHLNVLRGSHWKVGGVYYLPTFSPQDAADRRNYYKPSDDDDDEDSTIDDKDYTATKRANWRFWMRKDIQKAIRLLKFGSTFNKYQINLYPTSEEVIKLLRETKDQELNLDIETDSNLQMTCFGFSFSNGVTETSSYVVPMLQLDRTPNQYYYGDTPEILLSLAIAMRDNTVVIHNSVFDLFVLAYRYGLPLPRRIYDTMLAHNRCYPQVEKSLGHCLSIYTDAPYHKNEGVFEPRNFEQAKRLYTYNGKDICSLQPIKYGIEKFAKKIGAEASIRQANSMVYPYLLAMLKGIKLDIKKRDELIEENTRWKTQIQRVLDVICGHPINPNSWQQVAKYLYEELGLPEPDEDKTASPTLLQHQLRYNVPAIRCILQFRGHTKENGQLVYPTYHGILCNPPAEDNERATTGYNFAGTDTFRLASRRLLRRWGTNLQNQPHRLRVIYKADKGKKCVQIDQAGAEALIVAYLCEHGNLRELFLNNIKSHVFVAMHLFRKVWEDMMGFSLQEYIECPIAKLPTLSAWKELNKLIKESDKWQAEKRYYFMAKQVCHSSNYGILAAMLRLNMLEKSEGAVVLSIEQADRFLSTYHTLFPEIRRWHANVIRQLRATNILYNLFGYPRIFTSYIDESMYKTAYAFVPQSTVGCITNIAFVEIQDRLENDSDLLYERGIDLLQNNHDSIFFQMPEQSFECIPELQKHLNRELRSPRGEIFHMKSEVSVGDNWEELEAFSV